VDIVTLQAYGYFFFTVFLVVMLYGYIYHLYTSKKKHGRDYEELSNMALHDDITDEPVNKLSKETKKVGDKNE
jgi:cytochrome c oxidase cbb3-type subunit IV